MANLEFECKIRKWDNAAIKVSRVRFIIIIIYTEYRLYIFCIYINKQVDYHTSKNLIFSETRKEDFLISDLFQIYFRHTRLIDTLYLVNRRKLCSHNRINDIIAFVPEWIKTRLLGTEIKRLACITLTCRRHVFPWYHSSNHYVSQKRKNVILHVENPWKQIEQKQ